MKHIILPVAMAITCVLAAVANVIITRLTGLDIFTFKGWFFVPVGAMALGMLGASGAIPAARYFNPAPTIIEAMLMVVVAAAATMVLLYYLDYATFVLDDGRRAADVVDFATWIELTLTKAHVRLGGVDTEVGEMGYYLAGVEFLGFLTGGFAAFLFVKGTWRCAHCGAYLRKLKTKKTRELTFDEAGKILELFEAGDLETVKELHVWGPRQRTIARRQQKALISFNLLGCPTCKREVMTASVAAFDGQEWQDAPWMTVRRNLSNGLSLRDQVP